VEDWQRILQVHTLVLTPQEDLSAWLKFASLCRKSGRLVGSYEQFFHFFFIKVCDFGLELCTCNFDLVCVGTVGEDVDLAADHRQGRESIFLPAAGHVRALQAHVEEQQQGKCTRFFRSIRLSIAIIVITSISCRVCVRV
jgi:hypothetical protein